jgi:hypothetical protein
MRLSVLSAAERLGLTVLVGADRLDRTVERAFTVTLRDPRRYLTGGELVLSGVEWWPTPADSDAFVAALAEADVAALCAGTAERDGGPVPSHVVDACRRHGVPLLEVPVHVSFATVSEQVVLWLAADRAEGAGQFLDRYRRLVAAVAEGGGIAPLVAAGAGALGTTCCVLGATGRVIAGPDAPDRALLAGRFRKADRLPEVVVTPAGPVTLLSAAARAGHRMVSWFLAVAGDHEDWEPVRRELAAVPEELRRSFRSRVLGPVLDYDAAHRSELVHTLRVFLRHSGSWSQTAAELHVHVNTLRYRIGRIAELTGRDLSTFPDRVDLYLALDQGGVEV